MTDPVVDEDGKPVVTDTPTDSPTPELTQAELLASIQSDGRQKYSTVEEALKSVPNAQAHIAQVETDNADLVKKLADAEAELGKRASVEEAVAKILQEKAPAAEPAAGEALTEDRLNKAIRNSFGAMEKEKAASTASASVIATLVAQLGTPQAASDAMDKASAEFGVDIKAMASTSPASVYKLMGIDPAKTPAAPVEKIVSTINPSALKPVQIDNEPAPSVFKLGGTTQDVLEGWRRAGKPKI